MIRFRVLMVVLDKANYNDKKILLFLQEHLFSMIQTRLKVLQFFYYTSVVVTKF